MRVSIDQLWQGKSTQPGWKQYPGQVEECINMTLDAGEGARKRNATDLVADIAGTILATGTDYYICSLRQYRIFISSSGIIALDGDGNRITVTDQTGGYGYLAGATADDIDTTASIDTLVVLNRTKTVLMEATDSYTVSAEVNVFSELLEVPDDPGLPNPMNAQSGEVWRVIIDENLDPAGYYEKQTDGSWVRVAASADADGRVDRSTWPHRLVYVPGTDSFVFSEIPFNDRLSGNSVTNRAFPFVNSTLRSVRFFSSRLAFIGRDSVNLTRANDIFTIFANNVNNPTDDDRISKDITQKNIGLPLRTEVIGESLFILCENGQMSFGSVDEALTTINGRLRQIKDLKALDIPPGSDGNRLVLMDSFKEAHLFAWSESSRTVEYVGSLSKHVEGYFDDSEPTGIWLSNNTTFVTTATSTVYVHDAYYDESGLRQSAWSTYTLNEPVKYIDSWEDRIRLVTLGSTWTLMEYLHRKPIAPTGFDFDPRLDRRVLLTGTYIAKDDQTEFVLTGRNADISETWVVTTNDVLGIASHQFIQPASVNGRRLRIRGKWTGAQHYVGWRFTSTLEMSKLYAGASDARPMLSGFNVLHVDTTNYYVEAGRFGARKRRINFQPFYLDAKKLDASMVDTGINSNLLLGDARETQIKIINNTPGTVTVSAVELVLKVKGRG